eukprot:Hpha_TRINITY_DN26635_c0_g1::TRINITY_DN26635_c0_g1_i1::g.86045::m.86045
MQRVHFNAWFTVIGGGPRWHRNRPRLASGVARAACAAWAEGNGAEERCARGLAVVSAQLNRVVMTASHRIRRSATATHGVHMPASVTTRAVEQTGKGEGSLQMRLRSTFGGGSGD